MNIRKIFKGQGNKEIVAKNIAWAVFGKVVNMLGVLFVGILIARHLGPEDYGLMNYVISYVTIFTILATFGLNNIEIRELSYNTNAKEKILGTCFCVRFIFALFSYLLVLVIVIITEAEFNTSILIMLYALTLFSTCFEVIRNYFYSILKNEYVVKSEITRTIIGSVIKIILLIFNSSLIFFVIAIILDTFLVASGYCIAYKKTEGSFKLWTFDKKIVPYYLKQAFPLVLSGAAVVVYERIDQVMIGNMLNHSEVGYFATAGKFLDLVLFLPMIISQTITPLLVQSKARSEKDYYEKAKIYMSSVVWISIVLSFGLTICSYWLISLTFGEDYLSAIPVLQILAWKTVGIALSSSGGQLIIIEKIQKWAVIRNIVGCIVCIILNYLFIPKWGIVGSAAVTIITVFVSGCFANLLIPSYHHIFKLEINAIFKGPKNLLNYQVLIR